MPASMHYGLVADRPNSTRPQPRLPWMPRRSLVIRYGTSPRPLGWRPMNAGPWSGRRLHFVGIGGAGMSGLAIVARALEAEVTGSDRAPDSPYLARTGLTAVPHAAENVPEGSEVVYSSAIPPDNPERAAARERGLRELHRADLLGEITRLRPTIAVTGTHDKTTTSSMVVHALRGCG